MTLTVTVTDNETGESESKVVPENDYCLLVTGSCYVSSIQAYPAKGTQVVTIKGRREVER